MTMSDFFTCFWSTSKPSEDTNVTANNASTATTIKPRSTIPRVTSPSSWCTRNGPAAAVIINENHQSYKQSESLSEAFPCPPLQFLRQQLIHQLRVGLPFGLLHHLANKEAYKRSFSSAVLLKLLGVCGDHFVD